MFLKNYFRKLKQLFSKSRILNKLNKLHFNVFILKTFAMAEGTYEYECERAELLGIDPPNRADWEEAERVRKENELAQQMTV